MSRSVRKLNLDVTVDNLLFVQAYICVGLKWKLSQREYQMRLRIAKMGERD